MAQINPEISKIQIAKTISIEYDLSDGWFAVVDSDWEGYDRGGAVTLGLDQIDALIIGLGALREQDKVLYAGKSDETNPPR